MKGAARCAAAIAFGLGTFAGGTVYAQSAEPPAAAPSAPAARPVTLYGRLDLIFLHDSNNSALGDDPALGALAFDSTDLSVAKSRLGAKFGGGDWLGAQASGRIEFDFMGGGSRTSPRPRLRFAMLDLTWSRHDLVLSLGQSDDVVGPLSTDAIAFPVESFLGDIGNRRPQVKVTKRVAVAKRVVVNLQGSIGIAETTIDDETLPEDLRKPTVPVGQGRVVVEWPGNDLGGGIAGAWGSYGSRSFTWASAAESVNVKTWTAGLDLQVPVGSRLLLAGEAWRGISMDLYRYTPASPTYREPGTLLNGGWLALTAQPVPRWTANLGVGYEHPVVDDPDQPAAYRATSWFGNVYYAANEHLRVGVEWSRWTSDRFRSDGVANKTRVSAEAMYRF